MPAAEARKTAAGRGHERDMPMFRRTKIVATVGPESQSEGRLEALVDAGVDLFRLNFSHGDLAEKGEWVQRIRRAASRRHRTVALLGDLQGPRIRAGIFEQGEILLSPGEDVTVTTRDVLGGPGLIPTTYPDLPKDVEAGNRILLDDGRLELAVLGVSGQDVRCRVRVGGRLRDRKGINLPGARISAPALSDKDRRDVLFCIEMDLDYVALSFVRNAADVQELRNFLYERKSGLRVVAKIEKPEAVADFDSILAASHGIMVARGDLGVEMSPEKVPLIQKDIIRRCNVAGKPVITATQMLESMVQSPNPTRAETSDVANAILDGTDAVMLSGETAVGQYPVEAVSVMVRVALDVEQGPDWNAHIPAISAPTPGLRGIPDVIGQAACQVAEDVGARAILAFTQTGNTAALVAKYRPRLPIYAVTPSESVRRRMALYSGVKSMWVRIEKNTEAQIAAVEEAVLAAGVLMRRETVVITMGSPLWAPGTTNLLKVHRLGTARPSGDS